MDIDEIIDHRMKKLGIYDQQEINEAIQREIEIRRVQQELGRREDEYQEVRRSQERRQILAKPSTRTERER